MSICLTTNEMREVNIQPARSATRQANVEYIALTTSDLRYFTWVNKASNYENSLCHTYVVVVVH